MKTVAVKIVITLLLVLGIALAGLLFVMAGFLFFAPETLIGTFRVGAAVGCSIGGAIIFIPILVFAVLHLTSVVVHEKEKKRKVKRPDPEAHPPASET